MIEQIRANILTESNIRDLVRLMDEEMDGVAAEQRERLENIEEELIEVRRRLDRVWHVIENSELDISDGTSRIREHRERQEKLEIAAEEARALLSEHRAVLDNVDTIAAFAEDMSEFLMTSGITECQGRRDIRPCGGVKMYHRDVGVQHKCHHAAGVRRIR